MSPTTTPTLVGDPPRPIDEVLPMPPALGQRPINVRCHPDDQVDVEIELINRRVQFTEIVTDDEIARGRYFIVNWRQPHVDHFELDRGHIG